MELQEFLSHLREPRKTSERQWEALCPAHDDSRTSLCISTGGKGSIVIRCQAGCTPNAVMSALGLRIKDLYPDPAPADGAGAPKKKKRAKIIAVYPYRDEDRATLYEQCRKEPKDFQTRRPLPGGGYSYSLGDVRRVLYRLPEMLESDPGEFVFIPEGEKDCNNLAEIGLIAVTNLGGASTVDREGKTKSKWASSYSDSLAGRHCVLLPDNDDPGRMHVEAVARSLHGKAASIRVLAIPGLPNKGDVSDWLIIPENTRDELIRLAQECPEWEPPAADPNSPNSPGGQSTDHKANEAEDDPHRLARIYLDKHCTHADGYTLKYWRGSWYRWDGRAYRELPKEELHASVNLAAKREFDRLNALAAESDKASVRVTRGLIGDVVAALAAICCVPSRVDVNSWIGPEQERPAKSDWLAMENGIVSISELIGDLDPFPVRDPHAPSVGACEFLMPHTPHWFSTVCLPYSLDLNADCPLWRSVITTALEADAGRIQLLQEWQGYCLTYDTSLQKFLVLTGKGGDGKSVACAVTEAIVGSDNVSHVGLEKFGERFTLTETVGKLVNIIGDVGELDKIAEGHLKSFTSGDRMTFDVKNKSLFSARPTARLMLSTNDLPRFADKSDGVWRRLMVIPFRRQVLEEEKIPGLDNADWWIRQSGEMPGIFNWALAGLRRLRRNGRFTIPAISREVSETHRYELDPVRQFLDEHYQCEMGSEAEIEANGFGIPSCQCDEVYEKYQKWCQSHGHKPLNSSNFGKDLRKIFPRVEKFKPGSGDIRKNHYKWLWPIPSTEMPNFDGEENSDTEKGKYVLKFGET